MAKQERAERTRANLVRAAAAVFDQVGYERATLAVISDLAQVTKGALSFHFAAKSDLARAVQAEACAVSDAALAVCAERQGASFQAVVDMTYTLVGLLEGDVVTRAGVRLTRELETPEDPSLHCHVNWLGNLFRALRRAEVDGAAETGVDARSAVALVMAVVVGAETMAHTPVGAAFGEGPSAPRETAQEWLARMWHAVRPSLAPGGDLRVGDVRMAGVRELHPG
ncbi:ScbR family autoregulator-binding transcription factor [Streptomyces sp. NPDC047821]|uniref:ScbR family autoregulator-binding transcription factor n=1 Tax=Streptomyces sp. NPDC047821 TaxID=3365488 RepID=UPI00371FB502